MLSETRSDRAIIVLDMINDFAHAEGSNFEPELLSMIPYIQGEVQYFRERMRSVIFCNTAKKEGIDPFFTQVIQPLSPRTGEICITKTQPNAFFNTDLADMLKRLSVRAVTIVGAFSHTSVITTAASALDHGLQVVVPETCVCGKNPHDHTAALRLIANWISCFTHE